MLRIIRRQISSQEGWRWSIGSSVNAIVSSQCSTAGGPFWFDRDSSRLNSTSKNICKTHVSKTRRDNRIRYFVVNQKVEDALDLLKKSVDRIPLDGSGEQSAMKYLKLPPPSVCNKVLHAAAKTSKRSIVEEAAAIIKVLRNQKVDIFSRTIITVFKGFKSLGQMDAGMESLLSHLDFLKNNMGAASKRMIKLTLSDLIELEVASRDKTGALAAFKLMKNYGVTPSYRDAIAFLRFYVHPHSDDMRRARAFISWMWFNNVYLDPQDGGVTCFQDIDDWIDECGAKSVFSAKVKEMAIDLEALVDVPEVLLAAAIGLCALEGNSTLAEEIKNKFLSQKNNGRILNSTLFHAYIRGGNPSKASSLIQDMRSAGSIPDEIFLQPLVLETYDRGSKSTRYCLLELLDSSEVQMPRGIREMIVRNWDNC
eukprot:jgi/Picsp_1/5003/NSC_02366-R1_pentatricopeptide repeat-containing protein